MFERRFAWPDLDFFRWWVKIWSQFWISFGSSVASASVTAPAPTSSFVSAWRTLQGNGGTAALNCLHYLFSSRSYHHLEEPFLAEMAGQKIGLNGRKTKLAWMEGRKELVQKRPVGGALSVWSKQKLKRGHGFSFRFFGTFSIRQPELIAGSVTRFGYFWIFLMTKRYYFKSSPNVWWLLWLFR